jgi:acyl-[acyl carrier protein]--UDP-N-acetylglucosamine O-acyltransferase
VALRDCYKLLCHDGLNVSDAIVAIRESVPDLPEVRTLVEFFQTTQRGVIR